MTRQKCHVLTLVALLLILGAVTTRGSDSGVEVLPPVLNIKTFFLFVKNEDVHAILQLLNSRGSHQHYFNIRVIRSMYCFGRKSEIRVETDDTQFFNSASACPAHPEVACVSNALQQAYMSKLLWIRFQSYSQTPLADAINSEDGTLPAHRCIWTQAEQD